MRRTSFISTRTILFLFFAFQTPPSRAAQIRAPVQRDVEGYAKLAKEPMPLTRQESDPKHAKAVPVLLCAEIIDEAAVRSAIDKAIKSLTPAYRRAMK